MKKSTFYDFLNRHADDDFQSFINNAKEDVDYIDWHDFCLPLSYGDAAAEYKAVRSTCALFDASPVKKYRFTGADAGAFLDAVMTRPMSRQKSLHVGYAVFCNEDGMLRDDGLLYKFAEDDYLLMVSELDHDEYFRIKSNQFKDLTIDEVSSSLSGLALQGPQSCAVLRHMELAGIERLKPFEIKEYAFNENRLVVARVGFTADLGYELWFEPGLNKDMEKALRKAESLLGFDINGYGLTALNALRLEGGFVVPGWDTTQTFEDNKTERTPAELGLSWVVDLDQKGDFIGKNALLKERDVGQRFHIMGFTLDQECDLEEGIELLALVDGVTKSVGTCPSVAWSYGLSCWVGLASVQSDSYRKYFDYHIHIKGQDIKCRPAKLPFVSLDRYRVVPAPLA